MIFSVGDFPANICTFITHGLAQFSNIHTLFMYGLQIHVRQSFPQWCACLWVKGVAKFSEKKHSNKMIKFMLIVFFHGTKNYQSKYKSYSVSDI